jgi:hypothetical protein
MEALLDAVGTGKRRLRGGVPAEALMREVGAALCW